MGDMERERGRHGRGEKEIGECRGDGYRGKREGYGEIGEGERAGYGR